MDYLLNNNDKISKLIFEPTLKYDPLYISLLEMWHTSKSTLEFLNRIERKINEFLQYKSCNLELLADEIFVTKNEYNLFHTILIELKANLIHFEPKRYTSEFKSIKNGIDYLLNYEYYYAYRDYLEANGYIFKIWEPGKNPGNYFSFQLRDMENGKDLKVVDLYPDSSKYYLGKGISVAIIQKAKYIFNKRIISSSNNKPSHRGEFNTPIAIAKVWEPMVKNGKAKYYPEGDYYYIL